MSPREYLRNLYMVYAFLMKHLGISFTEVRSLSPDQRKLFISCLKEYFQREKEALDQAAEAGGQPQLAKLEKKEDYEDYTLPKNIKSRIQDMLVATQRKEKK